MNYIKIPLVGHADNPLPSIKSWVGIEVRSICNWMITCFNAHFESVPGPLLAWVDYKILPQEKGKMIRRIQMLIASCRKGNFKYPEIEARVIEDFKDLNVDLQQDLTVLLVSRPDYGYC